MKTENWTERAKDWARDNATNILRVAIVLLFLGLAVWAITLNRYELVIADHEPWLWLSVALIDVGPELAGIVIGVVTIDYLNEWRQDEQLKKQLILQLSSAHNDVTDTALRALRARGWVKDGSLSEADLGRANLSRANLARANLSRANLGDANLSGANLARADLSRAYLARANLSGVSFRGANLSDANLNYADLSGANLQDADLSDANLDYANLSDARLFGANLSGAILAGANLSEANLARANLSGAFFLGANLSGANLDYANLSRANLARANLSEADLGRANLSGANLVEANLRRAYLARANLSRAQFWTIEQLEQTKTLEGAIMPDGVQLGREETKYRERIEGPTFEEWKAQSLAKYGGAESDIRGTDSKPDDVAEGQAESGSPEPS